MASNRVYTPEEKLKIVLEGMSGTISVADLCRKYDLKPARFYYWKDQLLKSAPEIFENRGRKVDEDRIMAEKGDWIVPPSRFSPNAHNSLCSCYLNAT